MKRTLLNLLIALLIWLPTTAQTPKLVRGPYLQTVTPSGITVRWRTDQPTNSVVRFGTTADQLNQTTTDANLVTDHIVTLKSLPAATRFYYAVGSTTDDVAPPANDQFFTTAPPFGSTAPVRIWALGDFGAGSDRQRGVLNAFVNATQTKPVDIWVWLGDNAYSFGYDNEFQQNVFNVYPNQFKNIPVWPAPGNHDYHDDINDFNIPYYSLTTTPQQGEAGGVPSNSKSYYSVDYGPVHLVALDSYGNEAGKWQLADTTGAQIQWLKRDLAANKLPWTIVYWHHPPYTKGSHNSDTEGDLARIRQSVNPILERYNVDLALFGHSHVYERSYLMRGHYGLANTFSKAQNAVDTSTGRYDGSANSCPIIRKNEGVVYVVNGCGGAAKGQAADFPMPAMVYSNAQLGGSMVIDVTENRLDAQWIAEDNTVGDKFTIMKNVNKTQQQTLKAGETATLTASWPGAYRWSNGQTGRSIAASAGGTYTVTDDRNCLRDTFVITSAPLPTTAVITANQPASGSVCAGATASIAFSTSNVTPNADLLYAVQLSDAQGSFVQVQTLSTGTASPISVTFPKTLTGSSKYALRVVASRGLAMPVVINPSAAFTVRPLPTATLAGSLTIIKGESAPLSVSLTGDSPWSGTVNGSAFSATSSPATVTVSPTQTTTFQLNSVVNSCGTGTVSGSALVTVQLPTGVEPFPGGELSVYPNPTHGQVTVDVALVKPSDITLRLTDSRGVVIWQQQRSKIQHYREEINLPEGTPLYVLTLQTDGQTLTRKLVRQ